MCANSREVTGFRRLFQVDHRQTAILETPTHEMPRIPGPQEGGHMTRGIYKVANQASTAEHTYLGTPPHHQNAFLVAPAHPNAAHPSGATLCHARGSHSNIECGK